MYLCNGLLSERNVVGPERDSGDDGRGVGFEENAAVADLVKGKHDDVLKHNNYQGYPERRSEKKFDISLQICQNFVKYDGLQA